MDILASTSPSEIFTLLFGDSLGEATLGVLLILGVSYVTWRWVLDPLHTVVRGILNFVRLRDRALITLEITPPERAEKSPLATEHLFSVLQKSLGRHDVAAIELVATRKQGIRYQLRVSESQAERVQKHLASYMPELKFKLYTKNDADVKTVGSQGVDHQVVYEVRQFRHYAFPLQKHDQLNESDPVTFLAGSMTQLDGDESMTLQLMLSPHYSRWATRLYNRILHKGYATIDRRMRAFLLNYLFVWFPGIVVWGLSGNWAWGVLTSMVISVTSLFAENEQPTLTPAEQAMYDGVLEKLGQPLFKADIRIAVSASPEAGASKYVDGLTESLAPFNVPGFQELHIPRLWPHGLWQRFGRFKFVRRLPSLDIINANVLSTAELASIYHFPYGTIKTEGMVRSHSKTLPAPLSMKQDSDFDVVIGVNKHHGQETPIGLSSEERQRHMYIVGGTGSGKTTMMKYHIVQDIRSGKGVAVVDPHGDLAEELLEHVPKSRKKDLIYLNPDDLDNPIGVNLLELPEGLSGNDLLREKDRVTESVVSVMRKIFSEDDSGGHRIEYILRNTIQTALTLEKPTLFTIFRLLNDGKYAKSAIKKLEDEDLKAFWKNELGKAGSMQKVKMAAGITAKIGRFLFSASARVMLEKEKSDIDFSEVLDGKILICNFSKGRLGEDTSMLFGVTILAKLQLASLKRSEQKQIERKPYYLYVDEFQNFATMSFVQMLSEARKYKLFLTMAEQSTQQQEDQKMVNIILANVGTVVAFRSGSPRDEELLLPLFKPYVEPGEIANLPAYNFYCRIAAVNPQEPISGETTVRLHEI